MKTYGLLLTAWLAASGCSKHDPDRSQPARTDPPADHVSAVPEAAQHAPDDSGINARDRSGDLPTAWDQSDKPEDLALVRAIRKAVVADDALSMKAKNVKIIVRDGHVTLRGPVLDEAERKAIRQKSLEIAGKGHVEDLLDVETRPAGSQEPAVPQPIHSRARHHHHH
jgi:hyperosmotically inducible protein